jgi:hypothetical protein
MRAAAEPQHHRDFCSRTQGTRAKADRVFEHLRGMIPPEVLESAKI